MSSFRLTAEQAPKKVTQAKGHEVATMPLTGKSALIPGNSLGISWKKLDYVLCEHWWALCCSNEDKTQGKKLQLDIRGV